MSSMMEMAHLNLVDASEPGAQRVAVLTEPFHMELYYAQIPVPSPDEVRIKIKYVGICGSDLEAFRGTRAPEFITVPARLGHEIAGVIDCVGENVVGLKVGDRVTCRYVWGAYAEYIVCKPFNVLVVPERVPMLATSLIEILPCVVHAGELAKIDASKNVLIMGQGVSGLMLTQLIHLMSPKALVVTDLNDKNLKLSKKYGATHVYKIPSRDTPTREVLGADFPNGFDVVIPALLEGDGMIDAIEMSAMCARVICYGCIGVCKKPIDFFKAHRKRLEFYYTEPRTDHEMRRLFEIGLRYVVDGMLNTMEIVDAIVPLSQIQRAFDLRDAEKSDIIHVLVDCEK